MMVHKEVQEKAAGVADVVASAGGKLVGRTRLQKTLYLLNVAGFTPKFHFEYKHYGPYSDSLATLANLACASNMMIEREEMSSWGGTYSVYENRRTANVSDDPVRKRLISIASNANPIELELAATAVFLRGEGFSDPWEETAARKPEKVGGGRLQRAKLLYQTLRELDTPSPLPKF